MDRRLAEQQGDLADNKAEPADLGAIDQNFIILQEQPVVEVHVPGAVADFERKLVCPVEHVAIGLSRGNSDDTVCTINYPVERYPEKVKSTGFDKQAEIEGCLAGIKGQYLIFDDNRVLNIRKHNGYRISLM